MAASRKDYEAIADGLRRTRPVRRDPDSGHERERDQWRHDVDAVARALYDTSGLTPNGNRRFDIDRFVAACEE